MTTATLRMPVSLPETRKSSVKSILVRFYNALIEARMRSAMRELAMHRHLIPADSLKETSYVASLDNNYPISR